MGLLSEGEEVRGRVVERRSLFSDSSGYTARAIVLSGGALLARFSAPPGIPLGWRARIRAVRSTPTEIVEVPEFGEFPAHVEHVRDDRDGMERLYGGRAVPEYVRLMIEQRAAAAGMRVQIDRDPRGVWVASLDTGRGVLTCDLDPDGVTLAGILHDLGLG